MSTRAKVAITAVLIWAVVIGVLVAFYAANPVKDYYDTMDDAMAAQEQGQFGVPEVFDTGNFLLAAGVATGVIVAVALIAIVWAGARKDNQ